jgi:hypothetical protein
LREKCYTKGHQPTTEIHRSIRPPVDRCRTSVASAAWSSAAGIFPEQPFDYNARSTAERFRQGCVRKPSFLDPPRSTSSVRQRLSADQSRKLISKIKVPRTRPLCKRPACPWSRRLNGGVVAEGVRTARARDCEWGFTADQRVCDDFRREIGER